MGQLLAAVSFPVPAVFAADPTTPSDSCDDNSMSKGIKQLLPFMPKHWVRSIPPTLHTCDIYA